MYRVAMTVLARADKIGPPLKRRNSIPREHARRVLTDGVV
jgi:hypothetical protein